MLRRTTMLLLLLATALPYVQGTTLAAAAEGRSGIGVEPAHLIHEAKPGSAFTVTLQVSNTTNAAVQLETHAVQARGAANGSLVQVDATASADAARNASLWLTFPQRRIAVGAGKRETVRIRVAVPDDARPGVHGAIAMFSVPTTEPGSSGAGVRGTAGLGAVVLLEVPGDATASARVVSSHGPSFVRSGDTSAFRARVENTGDTLLRLDSELRLDGIVGATRVIGADEQLALPGGQRTFRFRYDDLPLIGRYTPKLTVVGGEGSDVRVTSELGAVWILPPWWLVAALVVAIVLAAAGTRARIRARRG